jgi:DNA-binding transcriptional ArsR family regulator
MHCLAKWPNNCSSLRVDPQTHACFQARARILKALAHPSRLFMVDVLSRGERCVCELTALVGADISTVSKHLAVLKGAGIVVDEKRGMQVYYTLRIPCVMRFFECVGEVMAGSAAADTCQSTGAAR